MFREVNSFLRASVHWYSRKRHLVPRLTLLCLHRRWEKDNGCGWSRDHLRHKLCHRGNEYVNESTNNFCRSQLERKKGDRWSCQTTPGQIHFYLVASKSLRRMLLSVLLWHFSTSMTPKHAGYAVFPVRTFSCRWKWMVSSTGKFRRSHSASQLAELYLAVVRQFGGTVFDCTQRHYFIKNRPLLVRNATTWWFWREMGMIMSPPLLEVR